MEKKIGEILSEGLPFVPKIIGIPNAHQKTSPIKKRLADNALEIMNDPAGIDDAMFHHSILCQTYI